MKDYEELFSKVQLVSEFEQKLGKIKIGQNFCQELIEDGIDYAWCIKHKEVLGCCESRAYYQRYQEYLGNDYAIGKHLLVHERKGEKRTFLIIVEDEKQVDLKGVREQLECGKLEFCSSEELFGLLHTVPGNVSLFHLKYDTNYRISLIIDSELLNKSLIAFHPLYNGMSLFLTPDDAFKYLEVIGRTATIMDIPSKNRECVLEKVI